MDRPAYDHAIYLGKKPMAEAPERVLLCLGPCHGEFYLPLDADQHEACPYDTPEDRHPIAIYTLAEKGMPLPDRRDPTDG